MSSLLIFITTCLIVSTTATKPSGTPSKVGVETTTESPTHSSTSTTSSKAATTMAAQTTPTTTPPPPTTTTENPLSKIRTFDFSVKDPEPEPAHPILTCSTADLCAQLPGICNNGTCKMPKCSTELVCVCFPGYTGQFCDKHVSKQHVNGAINKINGKSGNEHTSNGKSGNNGKQDTGNGPNGSNGSSKKKETKNSSGTVQNGAIDAGLPNKNGAQTTPSTTDAPLTEQKQGIIKDTLTMSSSSTTMSSKLTDGSGYVKGPEVYVATDSSVVKEKSSKTEILIEKPTVINKISDTVTLSTVSMKNTKVGVPQESLVALKTKKSSSESKSASPDNTPMNGESQVTSPTQKKDNAELNKSNGNIVSNSIIEQSNKTIVTEITGAIENSANSITSGGSVSSDIKDIKITIEPAKKETKKLKGGNVEQNKNVLKIADKAGSDVNTTPSMLNKDVTKKESSKNAGIQATTEKPTVSNDKTQQLKAEGSLATEKVLVSSDIIASASQHSEIRKMQSSVLKPLFKFLSIIGTSAFADNVSAVKIEIITKNNETSPVKSNDVLEPNKYVNVTISPNSALIDVTDSPVVDKPSNKKESVTP